ncbi:hypothetical protein, partial [Neisseria meningitidis serogroup B]
VESKETVLSGKFPCRRVWIPAFAGMTVGGVSVFSDKVLPRCVAGFPPARE